MKKKYLIIIAIICFICIIGSITYYLFHRYDNCGGDKCPRCESTDVGKFFYGLYDPNDKDDPLYEEVQEGKYIPGGCVIDDDSPRYGCYNCGLKWGKFMNEKE